jgi:hypothetical protein
MTPENVHYGHAKPLFQQRAQTLHVAFRARPARFKGKSTTTAKAAYRRLNQSTKTGDHHHKKPQSFDTKLIHPGVSKSLTRSGHAWRTARPAA